MTSFFLIELDVEFHTCIDGLTAQNLLPCVLVRLSSNEDMTDQWRTETSPLTALLNASSPCKAATASAP
jgi:hypothetical protein